MTDKYHSGNAYGMAVDVFSPQSALVPENVPGFEIAIFIYKTQDTRHAFFV